MARLILQMQTSVDGKVSAADPELGWNLWSWVPPSPWDEKLLAAFNDTLATIDHVLLSRPMVEGYVDHWTRIASEHGDDPTYDFARRIVAAQKVVVTEKPVDRTWDRVSVRGGDLAEVVRQVKSESRSGVIAFGGTGFAASLLEAGVVDELQMYVNPTAVSKGDSIFRSAMKFELMDSTAYDSGMVVTRYQPI